MNIFHTVGDFFLSAWIWNITFDWFHPVITGVIMFLMLRIVMRRKRLFALTVTVGAQLFAFLLLCVIVNGILINALNWTYEPFDDPRYALSMMNELYASLSVGLIYSLFQTIGFFLARFIWTYNAIAYSMIAWISNGTGMLLSYLLIRMVTLWHYH